MYTYPIPFAVVLLYVDQLMQRCHFLHSLPAIAVTDAHVTIARTCPGVCLLDLADDATRQSFATRSDLPSAPARPFPKRGDMADIPLRDFTPLHAFARQHPNIDKVELMQRWKELPKRKKGHFLDMARIFRENLRYDMKYRAKLKRVKKRLDAIRDTDEMNGPARW